MNSSMKDFLDWSKLATQWNRSIFILLLAIVLAILLQRRYRKGVRDIPGPFFASILPLDRVLSVASGHQFLTHIKYHEKYGSRVRVGPNHVSISDASVIPQIYGITTSFTKVRLSQASHY